MTNGENEFPVPYANMTTQAPIKVDIDGNSLEVPVTIISQPKQLKMEAFKNIIELGQFGQALPKVFIHGEESPSKNVFDTFTKYKNDLDVAKASDDSFGLPSNTLQKFLGEEQSISGIVFYIQFLRY
jgi:hypothetical protein